MSLTEDIHQLIRISQKIAQLQRSRRIGYLLIPFLIGILVVYIENKHIRECTKQKKSLIKTIEVDIQVAFNQIQTIHSAILKSGTYLIYSRKADFLRECEIFKKNSSILRSEREYLPKSLQNIVETKSIQIQSYKQNIERYNEHFIQSRMTEYVDLFRLSGTPLDQNQQRAVITDDKHNLVIAGAGSGKTETLITRIAYLTVRKPDTIRPERILALAFQNKAAQEMRDRLQDRFGVTVKVKTFHALGWEILQNGSEKPPALIFSGDNVETQYNQHIKKIFNRLKSMPDFQKDIMRYVIFFGENFLVQEETDFSKKKDFYEYISNLSYTALNGVKVKSEAERAILNFLLTHTINGKLIRVKYESPASWFKYLDTQGREKHPRPDFFLEDYNIYIEHWAVDKGGNVPSWFSGVNSSNTYISTMKKKRSHFLGQTIYSLLETFHWEFQEQFFLEKLQERLLTTLKKKYPSNEFVIEELYSDAIIEKVWKENNESIDELSKHCADFITIAKTYHLSPDDIRQRLAKEKWTGRQRAFATLALKIYTQYETALREKNCVDFSDMINLAIDKLRKKDELYRNVFDHILIDEYQDISTQRSLLIKALMDKNEGCKLFCVGDDWQSIMGFTGSNLDFFVNFDQYFDHPARTDLTVNYRSCKSIVDLGAAIISRNGESQIKKETFANNTEEREIIVYSSTFGSYNWKKYYEQMMGHCIGMIDAYLREGYKPEDILILARIVKPNVIRGRLLEYAKSRGIPISTEFHNPHKIHLMSVHRSKGLQARVVFILDVVKGRYGFPCELENPDILAPAIKGTPRPREEEERRIFYVAATRAKEDLIIYTQKNAQSVFLKEIEEHLVNKVL